MDRFAHRSRGAIGSGGGLWGGRRPDRLGLGAGSPAGAIGSRTAPPPAAGLLRRFSPHHPRPALRCRPAMAAPGNARRNPAPAPRGRGIQWIASAHVVESGGPGWARVWPFLDALGVLVVGGTSGQARTAAIASGTAPQSPTGPCLLQAASRRRPAPPMLIFLAMPEFRCIAGRAPPRRTGGGTRGAGVSGRIGVPTFRDAQTGLWARLFAGGTGDAGSLPANPQLVWDAGMPGAGSSSRRCRTRDTGTGGPCSGNVAPSG